MAPTELDDLQREPDLPAGSLEFDRDARLFATQHELAARLSRERTRQLLVSDELLHPTVPADIIVRRGNLRVTELLPESREVTRAVLQAGATVRTRADGELPAADVYRLREVILMALGDTEVWILPAGALDERD